ncbi:MAG: tRNA pseudouridine(55) synthase TruB [Candidatus Sulfotelmatobacter sp.]
MNGLIIIDKPAGWTSHDVVNRMRRILQQRSVGHLGTLDPLATGVLPLVTGGLTRLAQFYTTSEKSYEGVIRFGFATNTYDADGDPLGEPRPVTLSLQHVQKLAAGFLGIIEQVPPPFSAKKIHGVPAYKLARKQKEVVLKPVQVEIKEFTILSVEGDRAQFRARVASGTYMRSVAHEMGQRLGSGAHLESLRRTAVAEFDITQAHTLEEIKAKMKEGLIKEGQRNEEQINEELINDCHSDRSFAFPRGQGSGVEEPAVAYAITAFLIHPRQLLPQFPSVTADELTTARIRSGRPVNLPELSRANQVKVFYGQRELIAIATRIAGTLFHPKIVFAAEPSAADTPVRRP